MKIRSLVVLLALASSFANAGGDAARAGAEKSAVCAACHGADFNTPVSADIPLLAGQYPDYLARALIDYKSGARKNPVMNGQTTALSAQDIGDISAYIGGFRGKLKSIPLQRFLSSN